MISKQFFFDSKAVLKAADKKTRAVLSKFGAFVRTAARSSIRQRKKPSPPGSPPSAHGKSAIKLIYFVYDMARRSVIIGPEKIGSKLGDAPKSLEHGGSTKVNAGDKDHPHIVNVTMAKRPFIGPAARQVSKQLPSLWKNSTK